MENYNELRDAPSTGHYHPITPLAEDPLPVSSTALISATEPDRSREALGSWWEPGRQLLKSIRNYQKWQHRHHFLARLLRGIYVLQYHFWSVVTASDIPLNCQIGGGLLLPHPNGIVIHPDAVIGPNCLILQQVTIVAAVKIGGQVNIGAGAKIIRAVSIGDHAQVGANAVVLSDIPAGQIAVGIPARVLNPKRGVI